MRVYAALPERQAAACASAKRSMDWSSVTSDGRRFRDPMSSASTIARDATSRAGGNHSFAHVPVRSRCGEISIRSQALSVGPDHQGNAESPLQLADPNAHPPGSPCSVKSAKFTSTPSGTLVPTFTARGLLAPFGTRATFEPQDPCTCATGEYRQYVRGLFTVGGKPWTPARGPHVLVDQFREDKNEDGLTYGHRNEKHWANNRYLPDQMAGCKYEAFDAPGFTKAPSGSSLAMDLQFIGELIDTGPNNKVLATNAWSVVGSGIMP